MSRSAQWSTMSQWRQKCAIINFQQKSSYESEYLNNIGLILLKIYLFG